jgi:hypothetical protein
MRTGSSGQFPLGLIRGMSNHYELKFIRFHDGCRIVETIGIQNAV